MRNGAILHAWMWSFNTITEHMDEIAEAGYTSIQTEPMSKIKVNDANGKKFTENWYYVYQPTNTSIGNFVVGSEDDLKAMTVAAHAHGIRIIVDVVANHFTADWNAIDSDWQKSEYFHARNSCSGSGGDNIDYSNRWPGDALPPAGPMGSEHRQSGSRQSYARLPENRGERRC